VTRNHCSILVFHLLTLKNNTSYCSEEFGPSFYAKKLNLGSQKWTKKSANNFLLAQLQRSTNFEFFLITSIQTHTHLNHYYVLPSIAHALPRDFSPLFSTPLSSLFKSLHCLFFLKLAFVNSPKITWTSDCARLSLSTLQFGNLLPQVFE
jgi:hypothetical protein